MGIKRTTKRQYPTPDGAEDVDVVTDLGALAAALDADVDALYRLQGGDPTVMPAGIVLNGFVASADDLPLNAAAGAAYITMNTGRLYINDGVNWSAGIDIRGPKGDIGPAGLSAYQIWLALGNTGTEQSFIDSLKGEPGTGGGTGGGGSAEPGTMVYRGAWAAGDYPQGAVVTHDGNLWIGTVPGTQAPGAAPGGAPTISYALTEIPDDGKWAYTHSLEPGENATDNWVATQPAHSYVEELGPLPAETGNFNMLQLYSQDGGYTSATFTHTFTQTGKFVFWDNISVSANTGDMAVFSVNGVEVHRAWGSEANATAFDGTRHYVQGWRRREVQVFAGQTYTFEWRLILDSVDSGSGPYNTYHFGVIHDEPAAPPTQWLSLTAMGADGKSAFDIAKEVGATTATTEADWISTLQGSDGVDGKPGPAGAPVYANQSVPGSTVTRAWTTEVAPFKGTRLICTGTSTITELSFRVKNATVGKVYRIMWGRLGKGTSAPFDSKSTLAHAPLGREVTSTVTGETTITLTNVTHGDFNSPFVAEAGEHYFIGIADTSGANVVTEYFDVGDGNWGAVPAGPFVLDIAGPSAFTTQRITPGIYSSNGADLSAWVTVPASQLGPVAFRLKSRLGTPETIAEVSGFQSNPDVDLSTAPTSGQSLVWNAATQKWVPGSPEAQVPALGLDGLTDVDLSTDQPQDGEVLVKRGPLWVPEPLPAGTGGGANTLDQLADVDTSTTPPVQGQTIVWDGTQWKPGAIPSGGTSTPNTVEAVAHGTNATAARPAGAVVVHWYGSADPSNAQPRDEWIQE